MKADKLCMLPVLTCKEAFMTRSGSSMKCLKANTSNFPENFLAFARNFPALKKTCSQIRLDKHYCHDHEHDKDGDF